MSSKQLSNTAQLKKYLDNADRKFDAINDARLEGGKAEETISIYDLAQGQQMISSVIAEELKALNARLVLVEAELSNLKNPQVVVGNISMVEQ